MVLKSLSYNAKSFVKFEIVNPFANFEKFRDLINELTVCDTFSEGLCLICRICYC